MPARYVERVTERFGLGADSQVVEIASNDGYLLQYFVERGDPGARHRAGGERRGGGALNAASRRVVEFFGDRAGREPARRGHTRRPPARQQRAGPRARPQRLRRGHGDAARARRRHHHGVPAPARADGAEPVRHHLPRALLVLLVPHGVGGLRSPRHPNLRRRGASDARRVAADLRLPRRARSPPDHSPGPTSCCDTERAAGLDRLSGYTRFPEQVRRTKRALLRFLVEAKEQGHTIVGVRGAGEGQHAPQLLRAWVPTSSTTPSTAARTSRASSCPARTFRSTHPSTCSSRSPTSCSILPWNLKDEIMQDMAHIRDWGGRFVFPIPEVTVVD